MRHPDALQVAADFSARLQRELGERIRRVRMFGSQARGNAQPGSDLDILVLVDRRDRNRVSDIAYQVSEAHDYEPDISPLILEESHFEHLPSRERRVALDILEEGIDV